MPRPTRRILELEAQDVWTRVQRAGRAHSCSIRGAFAPADDDLLRDLMMFVRHRVPFAWIRWGDGELGKPSAFARAWPTLPNLYVAVGTFFMCRRQFRTQWNSFADDDYTYVDYFYLPMGDPCDEGAADQRARGVQGWIVEARNAGRPIAVLGPAFLRRLPFVDVFIDEHASEDRLLNAVYLLPHDAIVAVSKGTAAKRLITQLFQNNTRRLSFVDVGRALNPYAGRAEFGRTMQWVCARTNTAWQASGTCDRRRAKCTANCNVDKL